MFVRPSTGTPGATPGNHDQLESTGLALPMMGAGSSLGHRNWFVGAGCGAKTGADNSLTNAPPGPVIVPEYVPDSARFGVLITSKKVLGATTFKAKLLAPGRRYKFTFGLFVRNICW